MPPRRIRLVTLSILLLLFFTLILHRKWLRRLFDSKAPEVQYAASILSQELESLTAQPPKDVELATWHANFSPGGPVSGGSNYTEMIVVGKLKREDISWMDEELPDFPKAVYGIDDRHAALRPPKNKGHEATVYLSYVIDFYDTLPDVSIFIHAHRWAWHNNDLLDKDTAMMIRQLNAERVVREGYMNLRCHWYPGCPSWLKTHTAEGDMDDEKKEEVLVAQAWTELWPQEKMPDVLSQPCCSQFAVSRDRIRAVSKAEYERLRYWLLSTKISDNMSGRIFEYLWQWIWKGESSHCPDIQECYCDGFGVCFDSDQEFNGWLEERYRGKEDDLQWIKWQIQNEAYQFYSRKGMHDEAMQVDRLGESAMMDFKTKMDVRWFGLWEKRELALANGRNSLKRQAILARIRGR